MNSPSVETTAYRDKVVVTKVNRELAKWRRLSSVLVDCDPQTILDTLEGETDLYEALLIVAEKVQEFEALAKGLTDHIADLNQRKSRLVNTAETLRNVILSAMDTADIPTIAGPAVTLSKGKVAGKLIVEDEAKIPATYFKPQDPNLDRKALTDALKEGLEVSGATLSNGGISLTMRVK